MKNSIHSESNSIKAHFDAENICMIYNIASTEACEGEQINERVATKISDRSIQSLEDQERCFGTFCIGRGTLHRRRLTRFL